MTITEVITTMIKADEGKWLTNGETYAKTVCIGKGDSAENWVEVDSRPPEDTEDTTHEIAR